MTDPMLPHQAEIVERLQEGPGIFTLRLRFTDPAVHSAYSFAPGQFNMLYLYGVGEVPISIVSDPQDEHMYDHTIRVVGRVTEGLDKLQAGDRIGVRGPFGRGWPLEQAKGRDVVVVSGGLGCAPVMSVINFVMRRREQFAHLNIVQGVKAACDLIWPDKYQFWQSHENNSVLVTTSQPDDNWPHHVGPVTELFEQMTFDPANTIVMSCGPEGLMKVTCEEMLKRGVQEENLFVSMERNMQCAVGHCGHCQYGPDFICRDGPVFSYGEIKHLFGRKGF